MRALPPLPAVEPVIDGVRLHVVDYGSDQPTDHATPTDPILLLAGPFTDSDLWTAVARDLAPSHRVLIPDLVGLGESEAPIPARAYSPGAQARRLLTLLDHWGIDRFTVVGHDLGGAVAVHLAAIAPGRARGLVLISTPLHREVWPTTAELRYLTPGIRTLVSRGAATDRARGKRKFLHAVDLPSVEQAAELVTDIPAMVLWGENDRVRSPAYGRRIAASLGAAWVPVLEGGHLLPSERPERVAEELHAFVSDTASYPSG